MSSGCCFISFLCLNNSSQSQLVYEKEKLCELSEMKNLIHRLTRGSVNMTKPFLSDTQPNKQPSVIIISGTWCAALKRHLESFMLLLQLNRSCFPLNYWAIFNNPIYEEQCLIYKGDLGEAVPSTVLFTSARWHHLPAPPPSAVPALWLFIFLASTMEPSSNGKTDNPLDVKVTCLRCIREECHLKHYRCDGPCEKCFPPFCSFDKT